MVPERELYSLFYLSMSLKRSTSSLSRHSNVDSVTIQRNAREQDTISINSLEREMTLKDRQDVRTPLSRLKRTNFFSVKIGYEQEPSFWSAYLETSTV